ncbi:MAG TPA: bifunctional UDP-N-acetylglucosamine diphosphorylase/glucosamine-1-phosphate N-acetyltransferase GlmU [Vitreimonas sp.]|uniref:bifunctional UDP-N-acetylglucosamine diphosphorylase/glucosamine-1-phosphate N-acetyltransferase GlmU n=1 Tax=Vitreimonas sp. TaxID=3069702 RepID=UPI002D5ED047|nr:bifunctional UDP-N-acetylglucosamine diphosphorylase/glucosamine-1-phosphate N-acetyltransferase GlmU [Vitreimonas sp.]HYD86139.1 bifunctional UDP-N-acetylglucosamine diphosphorylase/glucosamine-1-phosphate N-acetyltransferase GlmU [Vitreimonas sp.]
MSRARAAIILAAGQGTRMKSELPKVLHEVGGRAMLDWAIAAAASTGAARTIVVTGAHSPAVGEHVARLFGPGASAIQDPPLGTAHAVRAAEPAMQNFEGDVAILYGDAPFVPPERIEQMFALRTEKGGLVVLGFEARDPTGYGRLLLAADGTVERIVEHKDATGEERAVRMCNSGVLCADARTLFELLAQVKNENAKGEYYLTDVVALARAGGVPTYVVIGVESDTLGVNSKVELAAAEAAFQQRMRIAAMEAGVTLIDPGSVFFSYDTQIAPDVVIEPNVFFGKGVKIAKGARIKAFCHIEGAEIGEGANVGPSARLRPGTKLGPKVKIGNFVEIKNASFGEKAQASHLAYIGDADIGARANLGCGAITCNYDGFDKYRTTIGEDAFIGSDTALVAPVTVGKGAYTGTGSVITKDVPDGALAVARARQHNIEGWADKNRAKKRKDKAT